MGNNADFNRAQEFLVCLDFLFQCHILRKSIFKTLTMLFIFYFFIAKNASQETMLRDLLDFRETEACLV